MFNTISTDALVQKMHDKSVVLVEALSEESYKACHLPGATNLPPDRVSLDAPNLLPDKEAEIIVYCSGPG